MTNSPDELANRYAGLERRRQQLVSHIIYAGTAYGDTALIEAELAHVVALQNQVIVELSAARRARLLRGDR